MALFKFRWLRRLVRKHTTPIPFKKASNWSQKLSVAYMFVAWNAFGYLAYQYYEGRNTKPVPEMERNMTPSQRYALAAGIEKAKVVQLKGFEKTGELEFYAKDYQQPDPQETEIPDEFDWNTQQNITVDETNSK